jgi:hypothetical protein
VSKRRTLLALLPWAFCLAQPAIAAETCCHGPLGIERVLMLSANYLTVSERGEVWVKLAGSITAHNPACTSGDSQSGWLVAVHPGDAHAKEYLAGLLMAYAAGQRIVFGITDGRQNARGTCTLTYYEIRP